MQCLQTAADNEVIERDEKKCIDVFDDGGLIAALTDRSKYISNITIFIIYKKMYCEMIFPIETRGKWVWNF